MQRYAQRAWRSLLLDTDIYRQQRDNPAGFTQGAIFVVLIGIVVGSATLIGTFAEVLVVPDAAAAVAIIHNGLQTMPWYINLAQTDNTFPQQFEQIFHMVVQIEQMLNTSTISSGIVSLFITPLWLLFSWGVYGVVAHAIARIAGGQATLRQTLACTALASSAQLLSLVQIVPFAQASGVLVVSLVASYIAIREAHQLPRWRALWATVGGPLVLVVIAGMVACIVFFVGRQQLL